MNKYPPYFFTYCFPIHAGLGPSLFSNSQLQPWERGAKMFRIGRMATRFDAFLVFGFRMCQNVLDGFRMLQNVVESFSKFQNVLDWFRIWLAILFHILFHPCPTGCFQGCATCTCKTEPPAWEPLRGAFGRSSQWWVQECVPPLFISGFTNYNHRILMNFNEF